jgi:cytochrome c biogenesis protein CcmG, thiol:disulfide interchange protein DsbE
MSKSRIAAIAAVIVVPVVAIAIVLGSLAGGDSSQDQPAPTLREPGPGPTGAGGSDSTPDASTAPGSGGAKAPDVALPVLDGGSAPDELSGKLGPASRDGTIDLDELRGSPIVLNVWSSDCPPCRAEARLLQSEWERLGRRGVLFLGLNVLDSPAAARRFRADYDVSYPSIEEQRADTARSLGASGVPETFFISKQGKVAGHVVGAVTLAQVELGVRAAQTGQATPTDQGGGQIPLR